MELSDDKIWEVTKVLYNSFHQEETEQKLNVRQLDDFKKQYIKPMYPHKITTEGTTEKYTCHEACCLVNPGYFCCCKATEPDSSFRKLGLGLCLYFKFSKHSIAILGPIVVLALLAVLICIWVSSQNGFSLTKNYSTFFFSTTIGAFASQSSKCTYSKISSQNNTLFPYQASASLDCSYGIVNYFGAIYSNQSQSSLYNCRLEIDRIKLKQNLAILNADPSTSVNSCTGNSSSCLINMNLDSNSFGSSTVSFAYQCIDQVYDLGFLAPSRNLFYFLISNDLLICFILIVFYISESRAQSEEIDFFKQQEISLNDFSLKIKGFNISTFEKQLELLLQFISNKLGQEALQQIVQIKTPDRVDFIEHQVRKEAAYKQLYDFIYNEFFDKEVNPCKFTSTTNFIAFCFSKPQDYEVYKLTLTKSIETYLQQIYYPSQLKTKNVKAASIFMVFTSINVKKQVHELQRFRCFSKKLKIKNKTYEVKEPPAPDLILWKNKGKNLVARSLISWLVTLVICFGSYALFGFIQMEQNKLLADYHFDINCNVLYQASELAVYNASISDPNYFSCFCQQILFSFDNPNYNMCSEWRFQYFTYLSIPIIMSLLLVIYNVIVSYIFRILTNIEAHRMITSQLLSYTIKRAFLLIMNMGLIIILLNLQYSADPNFSQQTGLFFLLQGKYRDITAAWYMNIGAIIILTMIFNISFPLIELALASLVKCIKRCWDKRICFKKTSCKTKQAYIDLYNNDIYPIEERYAFLIAVFIITLAFSCVIPILYIIATMSVLFLYLTDKVLVFRLYQTPINYGPDLHKLIKKALYFGLTAHMMLSAVFLSQPELIVQGSAIPQNNQIHIGNSRINTMLSTSYIIPYLILLFLLVGWAIFDNTLITLCSKFTSLCRQSFSDINKQKLYQNYFESITRFQLFKLKKITENQFDKIIVKNKNYEVQQLSYRSAEKSIKNQQDSSTNKAFIPIEKRFSRHQLILRNTLDRIIEVEKIDWQNRPLQNLNLLGQPGYEMMMNDKDFDQNRKNIILTNDLNYCLQGLVEVDPIGNQDL